MSMRTDNFEKLTQWLLASGVMSGILFYSDEWGNHFTTLLSGGRRGRGHERALRSHRQTLPFAATEQAWIEARVK